MNNQSRFIHFVKLNNLGLKNMYSCVLISEDASAFDQTTTKTQILLGLNEAFGDPQICVERTSPYAHLTSI